MNDLSQHPESDLLLAMVEGEVLDAASRARAEALLTSDPNLARALHAMRADRLALSAWGAAARAPEDMLPRVEAELDRAALAALAGEEAGVVATLPVSRVEYARPSILTRLSTRQWSGLAAAAGLAVVAGLVFVAVKATRNPLARPTANPGGSESLTLDLPPLPDGGTGPGASALAQGDPAKVPQGPTELAGDATPGERAVATRAHEAPRPEFGLPLDRALTLAAEGRLVVRVRAVADELRVRQHVGRWASGRATLDAGVRLALSERSDAPAAVPGATSPAPAIASESGNGDRQGTRSVPSVPEPVPAAWRLLDDCYSASCAPSKAALRKLLTELRQGQFSLELIEVPEGAKPRTGAADPDALLWWTRAATWNPPLTVPVVIEVR